MINSELFFRKDSEGNTLYFPWGFFSSGYIVDSDDTKQIIIKFQEITIYLSLVFVGIMLISTLFFEENILMMVVAWTGIMLLFFAGMFLRQQPILAKMQKSSIKLGINDQAYASGVPLSTKNLKVVLVLLIGMTFGSIFYSFFATGLSEVFLIIAFFMLSISGIYWKILVWKIDQDLHPQNYTMTFDTQQAIEVENMKFTPKNIMVVLGLCLMIGGGFFWYIQDAQDKNTQRQHLYQTMDVPTYANYLAIRNAKGGRFDSNAYIFSADAKANKFILNLWLKDESNLEAQTHKYKSHLRKQACQSKALSGFLRKGGENHYRFYPSKERVDLQFEVVIVKEDCEGY